MSKELKLGYSTGYWSAGPPKGALEGVKEAERLGFDSVWTAEAYGSDALSPLAWWGSQTEKVRLGTSIMQMNARTPTAAAMAAITMDHLSNGRFILGLGVSGPQVVEGWYGQAYGKPLARTREYVEIVRNVIRRDKPIEHHGEFYDLTFITPQWSPGRIDAPDPKVDVAAVNPWMLRMAGEVADGVHVHPIGEPGYLRRHVVPNVLAGARSVGRDAGAIDLIVPVMTIVGDTDEERHAEREHARTMLSFYGSTPNYAFVWDEAGFEGTTARIREKQKAGDFAGMAAQITDDHLAVFAVESTWDGLAGDLTRRYEGLAARVVLYNAARDPERFERYGAVARSVSATAH